MMRLIRFLSALAVIHSRAWRRGHALPRVHSVTRGPLSWRQWVACEWRLTGQGNWSL